MAKLVSKVYGDALFEAAMERDMLSPVYEEVQSLQTVLMENADLVQFLNHPQIIKEEKLKVVRLAISPFLSYDMDNLNLQPRGDLCTLTPGINGLHFFICTVSLAGSLNPPTFP